MKSHSYNTCAFRYENWFKSEDSRFRPKAEKTVNNKDNQKIKRRMRKPSV